MKQKIKYIIPIFVLIMASVAMASDDPSIVISSNEVSISPGESFNLELDVHSSGGTDAFDVGIEVTSDNKSIVPVSKSTDFFNRITSGTSKKSVIRMISEKNIDSKIYSLSIKTTYQDSDDKSFTKTTIIGINVVDDKDPQIDAFFVGTDSQPYPTGKTKLTLDIANVASERAYSVIVNADTEAGFITRDSYYIGDLAEDDFDTIDFEILFNNVSKGIYPVNFEINYKDENDNIIVKNKTINISLISYDEAMLLFSPKNDPTMMYLGIIIILVLLFWFFRRKKKKHK